MMDSDDENENIEGGVVGKLTNVKMLEKILRTVHLNDEASIYAKHNGLKMTVEAAKTFQANAFIQREMFNEFTIDENDEFAFNLSLDSVLKSLGLFGLSGDANKTSTASSTQTSTVSSIMFGAAITNLVLHYKGYGEPFTLWMEEDGVVSRADVPTQDVQETLYFDFGRPNVFGKVVMITEHLKEIFNELDLTSEVLEVSVDFDTKSLNFSTFGNAGEVTHSISHDCSYVHVFECRKTTKAKYPMNLMKNALKAIHNADKLSLRMDLQNVICLQYMINFKEGNTFLEFYCVPEIDCENED